MLIINDDVRKRKSNHEKKNLPINVLASTCINYFGHGYHRHKNTWRATFVHAQFRREARGRGLKGWLVRGGSGKRHDYQIVTLNSSFISSLASSLRSRCTQVVMLLVVMYARARVCHVPTCVRVCVYTCVISSFCRIYKRGSIQTLHTYEKTREKKKRARGRTNEREARRDERERERDIPRDAKESYQNACSRSFTIPRDA